MSLRKAWARFIRECNPNPNPNPNPPPKNLLFQPGFCCAFPPRTPKTADK